MIDELLYEACQVAEIYKYDRVEAVHVVYALLRDEGRLNEIDLCGLEPDHLMSDLEQGFRFWRKRLGVEHPRLLISDAVMTVLEESQQDPLNLIRRLLASTSTARPENPPHLSDPLPDLDELLDTVERERAQMGFEDICEDVFHPHYNPAENMEDPQPKERAVSDEDLRSQSQGDHKPNAVPEKSSLSAKERAEAMRAVERSIKDLTQQCLSGQLDPVIGRDLEIDKICQVLMRRRKSNVLLVGEPGVGKAALMEGVAARMAGSPDPALSSRPVLQASLGALVAGARYRGDFEVRMELLVDHATSRHAVLFFDEMQMLVGSGATAERGMDGANLLKPVLARDGMSLVGATTNEEAEVIRKDPALMRRFEPVMVDEPDPELMREIIAGGAHPYLTHHAIKADSRILDRMIDFADRYIPDRRFPDKAFDLLDASCVQARISGRDRINVENIRTAVRQLGGTLPSDQTGLTSERIRVERRILNHLSGRIGGHPDAIRHVARTVAHRIGSEPVVLQLDGPAGVGRRTVSRELSRAISGHFIEIDASSGPQAIRAALISGARPGVSTVILLNMDIPSDPAINDLMKDIRSTRSVRSDLGATADMRSTIIMLRNMTAGKQIGFSTGTQNPPLFVQGAEILEMPGFTGERLLDAVRFELARLSRVCSDAGQSRPVPDPDDLIPQVGGQVGTWSELVDLCGTCFEEDQEEPIACP